MAGLSVVVTAVAGCSNGTSPSSTGSAAVTATKVVVDGQDQHVAGQASCTVAGDNVNVGVGDAANGIGAVVTSTNPPAVHSVGLGTVDDVTLGFSDASSAQAPPTATKDGKSYKISGTATGVDTANNPVSKTFEIDAVCP